MNILIIEDDSRVADFLERGLRAEGYGVAMAKTGPEGLRLGREMYRDGQRMGEGLLILLDLMLPQMDGMEVCQSLRAARVRAPIMMLTALDGVADRVAGLRMGADDYMIKPFAFEELLARIEALARRPSSWQEGQGTVLSVGDLELDRGRVQARRGGKVIELTAKELALLELLMSAPGRVFSRERILATVWGSHADPLTNIVDVYIRRLRAKIDDGQGYALIVTVRGLGYRINDHRS